MKGRATSLCSAVLIACFCLPQHPLAEDFDGIVENARDQEVYFNAWGGSRQVNGYIRWVAERLEERFGIELVHVKLEDTAEAVARVLAEKAAGQTSGGSVDLVWINGENFAAMKENGLLFGPFTESLPNTELVDHEGKPTTLRDFTVAVEGMESPWGMAQFVLIHDEERLASPPRDLDQLAQWISENRGRFTYPAPPDFVGTTFLKHILLGTAGDVDVTQPPGEGADQALDRVWAWLDRVQGDLWRAGTRYPSSGPELHRLFEDGEVALSMAFNPGEAASLVLEGRFPESTRSYTFDGGSIGNTHFVAIPFNAANKEAAMVTANFLLSPEAQAEKQKPTVWGDFTVLDLEALSEEDRALFEAIDYHPATPRPEELGPARLEPHPAWVEALEEGWVRRYGS